jgi:threonylcarbamoyladenosine tRNA methylthiotransferase MtaB
LKIQDGCDNYCTYCIIPYARGHLRSRSLASIARETRNLAAAGFREIVLTGINLGAYGRETGQASLADAVRTVLAEPRIARVRLSSTESLEVSTDLINIMAEEPRLCPHLHLPLQAGADRILAAMHRPYTTGDYARLLEFLRSRVPDLAVTTDIIVGFPGETPELFAETLAFAKKMKFAKIHVFPYSRRTGTPAASFAEQVDDPEKKQRVAELLAVGERSGERFRQRFVGRIMPVLVEKGERGRAEGLTPNYQRALFFGGGVAPVLENSLIDVVLEQVTADGFRGRLAE